MPDSTHGQETGSGPSTTAPYPPPESEATPRGSHELPTTTDSDDCAIPAPASPTAVEVVTSCTGSAAERNSTTARWWVGVVAGAIASLPLAWLLSYAAFLMFFLGLFFFALFGLLIGAVVYRVAFGNQPYSRTTVLLGTTILVAVPWTFSIVKEAHDFPGDMGRRVVNDVSLDLGQRSTAEYRAVVADEVRFFLQTNHGSSTTLGYIRWVVASGEIPSGALASVERPLRTGQYGMWWVVRVVLSIALLAFGIGSQTFSLRQAKTATALAGATPAQ